MINLFLKKHIVYLILIFLFSIKLYGGTIPFITTWKTDNVNDLSPPDATGANQIRVPTFGVGYNYTVDWGDGTLPTTHTGDAIHTYLFSGTYIVSITGDFPRIYFNATGDVEKIISIEQWGDNVWTSMENAFRGCVNLQGQFIDIPNLSNVESTAHMFNSIKSIDVDISSWDVSNIKDMQFMFNQILGFNLDITNWDVSHVTNMAHMFEGTEYFNQDISGWDISNVTDMSGMFNNSAFNQDISVWDVSNVTSMIDMFNLTPFNYDIGNWDVSSVTDMQNMFTFTPFNHDISNWDVSNVTLMGAMFASSAFNQDIGNWDVGNVTQMQNMFGNCPFDQDIGGWDVSNVEQMHFMFEDSKLSIDNYDALLIGWNNLDLQPRVNINAGHSVYSCRSAEARRNMIENDIWTITDGGSISMEIFPIGNISANGSYIFPEIDGNNLSFEVKYFTEPEGNGIAYLPNDVVSFYDFESFPITLYAYDYSPMCTSEVSFQLTITEVPLSCPVLTIPPLTIKSNVPLDTNLVWKASNQAMGYRLSVGTTSGGTDIINNLDVGNVLMYDFPNDLPLSTQIFVNIIPYNIYEEGISCQEAYFRTINAEIPKYFTPNNDGVNDVWSFSDPSNLVLNISIYNRYGKLLKQYTDASIGWDGIYLNNLLPTSDYWYIIQYNDGQILKGHFALKR